MPNRYVRASAIESEPVNSLNWQSEVFYRRLINRADDFGRFTGNLALLRASLFPLQLEKVSVSDTERMLAACEKAGLVFRYNDGGKPFLVLNKWEQGRAKHSEYPKPPQEIEERMKTHVFICKHMSAYVPDTDTDPDSITDTDSFERFWDLFPKKVAKKQAVASFRAQKAGDCLDELLKGVMRDCASDQWQKENGRFIPNPTTYLNQRRWESEIAVPPRPSQQSLI